MPSFSSGKARYSSTKTINWMWKQMLQQIECGSRCENPVVFYQAGHKRDLQKCKVMPLFSLYIIFVLGNIVIFHKNMLLS